MKNNFECKVQTVNKQKFAKPIFKSAGGKSRVAPLILKEIPNNYLTYYEPFVGGGALFFELLKLKKFKKAVLGDNNIDLMTAYDCIKNDVDAIIRQLHNSGYKYTKKDYLLIRELDPIKLNPIERAARFIYLNKTAFNGLWRSNKAGKFNVPFGKYNNPKICDEENLRLVSGALKKAKLIIGDFEKILKGVKKGDLVYLDPLYIPISKTSSFTAYGADGFSSEDHWRLRGTFENLVNKGATVILSNSSAPLSYKLYSDYKITEIQGSRNIGGPASYRQPVKELIIVGELKQ